MKEDFENSIGPPIYFPMANENHRLGILRPKVHHEGLGRGTLEGENFSREEMSILISQVTHLLQSEPCPSKKTIAESIL